MSGLRAANPEIRIANDVIERLLRGSFNRHSVSVKGVDVSATFKGAKEATATISIIAANRSSPHLVSGEGMAEEASNTRCEVTNPPDLVAIGCGGSCFG